MAIFTLTLFIREMSFLCVESNRITVTFTHLIQCRQTGRQFRVERSVTGVSSGCEVFGIVSECITELIRPHREVDHSPVSSAEVWSYLHSPTTPF
jgi:hypothetical protein